MINFKQKTIVRFIPSLLWMAIIFYFSSQPTDMIGGTETFRTVFFKSIHLGEYAVLGILLYFGFKKKKLSLVTGYLYAVTDEIHQNFVIGRHCRFSDTIIDFLGIVLGLFLFRSLKKVIKLSILK
jgi:VanZ family protein